MQRLGKIDKIETFKNLQKLYRNLQKMYGNVQKLYEN